MKKSLFCGVCLSALVAMGGVSFADIQLGVGAPLTGSRAAFGEQIKRGVEAAVAEANAKGGMNGEQITIVYGDDAADPKQGISVANKFVGDGVQFVIGHFNSGVSIPTSDIYAENGVLMIAPGTTNPTFTERELWNTFRTCRRDDQQGHRCRQIYRRQLQGRQSRNPSRQDPLRSGPCRRNQEVAQRQRHEGNALRRCKPGATRTSPRSSPR